MKIKFILISCAIFGMISSAKAQVNIAGQDSTRRVITTAVPFLLIATDARAGAMGDAGVATSPDANATHWNIAKLAFIENDIGFSLSYTPWLAKIVNDMSLAYLSGYYKINREQSVAMSLSYFNLGNIQFTDQFGNPIQNFNPKEFSFSGSYSRMLSENMSIGVTLKYIHSNLTGDFVGSGGTVGMDSHPGNSISGDIGWYWNKDIGQRSNLALGATIVDIGNKLTYSSDDSKEFIPTTLRFGSAYTYGLDEYNSLTFALDFNKLMVPTPPVYMVDENGSVIIENEKPVISRGKDPDRALLSGMFGSFTDAPDGMSEELKEVMVSFGMEYWYKDLFSLRGGYFWEHYDKGDRKFFTMGLGVRYNVFGVDFAYLVPQKREHPLAETLRFTLHFNWDDLKKPESIIDEDTN